MQISDETVQYNKKSLSLPHKPSLEGMRGVAISLVLLLHLEVPGFAGGLLGVSLFFVLSGFLITSSLLVENERNASINLGHFYWRRVLRLLPALVLFLCSFVLFATVALNEFRKAGLDALVALCYVSNWTRAFNSPLPAYLGHLWSLAIEEQFYLIWPVVLLALLKYVKSVKGKVALVFALALLSWGTRACFMLGNFQIWRIYNGFDSRCDGLFLGAAAALAVYGAKEETFRRAVVGLCSRLWPAALAVVIALVACSSYDAKFMYIWGEGLFNICTMVLIVVCFASEKTPPVLAAVFENFPLVYIGKISYGLYVWHLPVIYLAGKCYKSLGGTVLFYGELAFLLCVCTASFYLVEKPILSCRNSGAFKAGPFHNVALYYTAASFLIGMLAFVLP